jgi:hypothetical protein
MPDEQNFNKRCKDTMDFIEVLFQDMQVILVFTEETPNINS